MSAITSTATCRKTSTPISSSSRKTKLRRSNRSCEILITPNHSRFEIIRTRRSVREELFKDFGAQIKLRRVLIISNREWFGVISISQLRFDLLNFVFLDEEEISVECLRQVAVLVIADIWKITQNPWKWINAGPNQMPGQLMVGRILSCQLQQRLGQFKDVIVSLHIDVRLGICCAVEIVQP